VTSRLPGTRDTACTSNDEFMPGFELAASQAWRKHCWKSRIRLADVIFEDSPDDLFVGAAALSAWFGTRPSTFSSELPLRSESMLPNYSTPGRQPAFETELAARFPLFPESYSANVKFVPRQRSAAGNPASIIIARIPLSPDSYDRSRYMVLIMWIRGILAIPAGDAQAPSRCSHSSGLSATMDG